MTHLVSVDRGNHLLTLREPVWGARPCPRSTRRRVPSASERPCWPHRPCSPRPAAPPVGPPRTPSERPGSRPRPPPAADAALGQNTQALAPLVDNLFGTAAGRQFTTVWGGHIRYFYAYADALGTKDETARK